MRKVILVATLLVLDLAPGCGGPPPACTDSTLESVRVALCTAQGGTTAYCQCVTSDLFAHTACSQITTSISVSISPATCLTCGGTNCP